MTDRDNRILVALGLAVFAVGSWALNKSRAVCSWELIGWSHTSSAESKYSLGGGPRTPEADERAIQRGRERFRTVGPGSGHTWWRVERTCGSAPPLTIKAWNA